MKYATQNGCQDAFVTWFVLWHGTDVYVNDTKAHVNYSTGNKVLSSYSSPLVHFNSGTIMCLTFFMLLELK